MNISPTSMSFGLFANFENPGGDSAVALRESVATVRHAEELGFGEVWITEHHFNRFSVSASIFPLLSHLAGVTRSIRLGTAAVLLPMHDILQAAEDAATVDALSGGRLLLGVARGGPFPQQFDNFGIKQDDSRGRLLEAVPLLERLLTEENVDFDGLWYRYKQVAIYPRPVQSRIPIWLASLAPESIALAAERSYGLMGPSPAPLEKLQTALAAYLGQAETPKRFVLSRFFFCHRDRQTAIAKAVPFVKAFASNMGAVIKQAEQSGATARPFGVDAKAMAEERILANSIIGDVGDCIERIRALEAALGPHTLILKPAAYDPADNRDALALFAERIMPVFAA